MSTVITLPNLDTTAFVAPPSNPFLNTKSLEFDGVDEYIDFGDNYDFGPATAFSVSMWIKPNNLAAQRALISKSTNDGNVFGWIIYHNASGNIFIQMRSSGNLRSFTFSDTLTAGVWQLLVFTYAGASNIDGAKVYIDAVLDGGTPGSGALGVWDHTEPLKIARRSNSFHYSGKMNQVAIWDKELSQSEVDDIYNSGTPDALSNHSSFGNVLSWWELNTDANFTTEQDQVASVDGTLTNMEAADYVSDAP